jgi:hypothetical protein
MKKLLIVAGIVFAVYWFGLRGKGGECGTPGAVACPNAELEEGIGVTLNAADVCPTAGYLCFQHASFQVMRWPLDKGMLRIHVPLPEFLDAETRQVVRDAAVEGLKMWEGNPLPLVFETAKRASRPPDFAVTWTQGLTDRGQAGHVRQKGMPDGKRLRYSIDNLTIVVPQAFATMTGVDAVALERIRATAAHEMGHVLGLAHSDSPNDIMYAPYRRDTTHASASARDFLTVEALYALPNGAMVR